MTSGSKALLGGACAAIEESSVDHVSMPLHCTRVRHCITHLIQQIPTWVGFSFSMWVPRQQTEGWSWLCQLLWSLLRTKFNHFNLVVALRKDIAFVGNFLRMWSSSELLPKVRKSTTFWKVLHPRHVLYLLFLLRACMVCPTELQARVRVHN